MRLKLPTRDRKETWHHWFAWYPVLVPIDLEGTKVLSWLDKLERRWVPDSNPHNWLDDDGHWEYLLPKGWNA